MNLKEAVEEQLDLILKLEEERKLMKKENKNLKEKINQLIQIGKKHTPHQTLIHSATNTYQSQPSTTKISTVHQSTQCENQIITLPTNIKLLEAQQMLKIPQPVNKSVISKNKEKIQNQKDSINTFKNSAIAKITKIQQNKNQINSQSLSQQIIRMSKQINTLKKQLIQSQKQRKTKERQILQAKKCIQVKNQALQKLRKDFNQLSIVFNADKYKSIRNLQKDLNQAKKNVNQLYNQNKQLKQMLRQVTQEYQIYKNATDSNNNQLQHKIGQLEKKFKIIDQQNNKYKKLLYEYEKTQAYVISSFKTKKQQ